LQKPSFTGFVGFSHWRMVRVVFDELTGVVSISTWEIVASIMIHGIDHHRNGK
jgi:hypothetical protein